MNDQQQNPQPPSGSVAGQHPHVPGQDPLGSGLPRQMDFRLATTPRFDEESEGDGSAASAEDDDPEPSQKSPPPGEGDAPLGGSQITEDQLTADTAVEEDALKSLDPDDTPA